MAASARLRLPDGREVVVGAGDLLGRTPAAAACIDDPRIAEAHAVVSLRHGELHLVSLRRALTCGGHSARSVPLRPGLTVTVADELRVVVLAVEPPTARLGLRTTGQPARLLSQLASVVGDPPRIISKLELDADAHLWSTGADWRLRLRGGPPVAVDAGHTFDIAGVRFTLVQVAVAPPARPGPLRVVVQPEVVELHRGGHATVVVAGTGARILAELVACQAPAGWELLARAVWPDSPDLGALRHRWDVALGRLRGRLRDEGVRELLRADGAGQVALELSDDDEVDDRTA